MLPKNFLKSFKRAAARHGILSASWLVNHLPFVLVHGFISGCLYLTFHMTRRHKDTARESLRLAFGAEKSEAEREEIVRKCFDNVRQGMIELLYFARHPQGCAEKCTIEGKEYLDQALAQGNGVIAVTAHFGNFPVMMLALSQNGYKVSTIMRRARDEKVAQYVLETMNRTGVKTIYSVPRRECVVETLKTLRNNEIVFVLMDQHFGSEGGVLVDFFGRKAATAKGPVILASRANAPLLPIFNVREADGRHRILVEPPMMLEDRPDRDEMILHNVIRITAVIERYIRRYPSEWGWMHRRWKIHEQADTPPGSSSGPRVEQGV